MVSPVIIEYAKIKEFYPEFLGAYDETFAKAKRDVQEAWGLKDGGLFPGANEYGVTTIRPRFFAIGTAGGATVETWNRNLSTMDWQDFVNSPVIEDVYIGLLGFMFPNVSQRVAAIRIEAGKQKFPVINLEGEIDIMTEPAVMFETGIIIPEEEAFKLRVHPRSKGYNIIKPLGFALAKSKVLINETAT